MRTLWTAAKNADDIDPFLVFATPSRAIPGDKEDRHGPRCESDGGRSAHASTLLAFHD